MRFSGETDTADTLTIGRVKQPGLLARKRVGKLLTCDNERGFLAFSGLPTSALRTSATVGVVSPERLCEQCEERPIPPEHKHYCDNVCRGLARSYEKGRKIAPTSFARFLDRKNRSLRVTHNAFASMVGIAPATLTRWRQGKSVPVADAYERLRDLFGDEVPVLEETGTDRKRESALKGITVMNSAPAEVRRERARRGGEAGRGGRKPRRAVALREEYKSGSRARPSATHAPDVTTPQGRARVSLGKYLRGNPFPSPEVLRGWAVEVSARIGLSEDEVIAAWRPKLRRWGLIKGGRPSEESRHVLVERLRAEHALPDGRVKWGFWRHAARMVREDEGTEIGGESLRVWWNEHADHCVRRNRAGRGKAEGVARRRQRHDAEIAAVAAGRARAVPPTMGPGDVAKALGVSRATIRRLMEDGTLKPVEVSPGGWRRYSTSEVAALARARGGGTAETA